MVKNSCIKRVCWKLTPFQSKKMIATNYWNEMKEKHPILNDWNIKWDKMYSFLGSTHYNIKTIRLSLFMLLGNTSLNMIKNIILHEIAHVLTEDEDESHGELWRKCFIDIGGNDKMDNTMDIPEEFYSWKYRCSKKGCKINKNKTYFLCTKNWKNKRCSECRCFMKKEEVNTLDCQIKNGYSIID